jgi:hypothetical protein
MYGKIKVQLVSCSNLTQIEWKRTHLEGKFWTNFTRCQWLCNDIIWYLILTSFYLSGKGYILRKQLVLEVSYYCVRTSHKIYITVLRSSLIRTHTCHTCDGPLPQVWSRTEWVMIETKFSVTGFEKGFCIWWLCINSYKYTKIPENTKKKNATIFYVWSCLVFVPKGKFVPVVTRHRAVPN